MGTDIQRFLDEEGRVKQLPAKHMLKQQVFAYLAERFELNKEYSETDVNAILSQWHTFGDYFVLRRGLVDGGFLGRLPNGSRYWRIQKEDGE